MIANDAHRSDSNPASVKSNTLEEGSELIEEADQRSQDLNVQRLLRNERLRMVIIGIGLLAIILSAVFYLFTGSIGAIFVTIVVVPLFYWCADVYLGKSEASAH